MLDRVERERPRGRGHRDDRPRQHRERGGLHAPRRLRLPREAVRRRAPRARHGRQGDRAPPPGAPQPRARGGAARARRARRELVGRSPAMRALAAHGREPAPQREQRADPGRERHRQGARRARAPRREPAARRAASCRSTAARCPSRSSRASSSGTSAAPSPARSARPGLFRMADGGTLFLDEIGEIPLARAGEAAARAPAARGAAGRRRASAVPVDIRVIAATQPRPRRDGRERALPPRSLLPAERGAHRRAAAPRAPRGHAAAGRRTSSRSTRARGRGPSRLGRDALEQLLALRLAGQRARARERDRVARSRSRAAPALRAADFALRGAARGSAPAPPPGRARRSRLDAYERCALERALRECGGDATDAARRLGIGRRTFYRKLARHGLRPARALSAAAPDRVASAHPPSDRARRRAAARETRRAAPVEAPRPAPTRRRRERPSASRVLAVPGRRGGSCAPRARCARLGPEVARRGRRAPAPRARAAGCAAAASISSCSTRDLGDGGRARARRAAAPEDPPALVVAPDADEELALATFRRGAADCVALGADYDEVLPVAALEQIQRHRAAAERGAARAAHPLARAAARGDRRRDPGRARGARRATAASSR